MSHPDALTEKGLVSAPLLKDARTIALLLAGTLVIMAVPTISPALAGLEARFLLEPHAALLTRLLVPAPSLAVVLLAPFIGIAADRFGKANVLLAGALVIAVAGTAGFYLPSLKMILVSRFVLGIGVAMIMTSQIALIGDCFEGQARARIMGWQISARNFAGMIFVAMGGVLAGFDPQYPFAVFFLAVLYSPLFWFAFCKQKRGARPHVQEGAESGPSASGWMLAVLVLAGFMMLTVAVFFQMPTQLPFFVAGRGYDSASATGTALFFLTCAGGLAALGVARLKGLFGMAGLFATGFAAMSAGFGILTVHAGLPVLVLGAACIGAGFAIVTPAFTDVLLQLVPPGRRGTASGMLTTGGFIGQILSPLIATPAAFVFGYDAAFAGSAVILLFLSLTALSAGKAVFRAKAI